MKVGFLVGYHHRFTGSQRSLLALVRGLPRARVEPLCLFPGEGHATRSFRAAGLPVRVVPAPGPLRPFGGVLARGLPAVLAAAALAPYTLALRRVLRRERVELLHCNDPRALLLGAPAARLARIPVVFHVRGELGRLGWPTLELCGFLSDRIIFVADAIRASFPARHRAKLRTVHNGVDPPPPPSRTRAELLASVGLAPEGPVAVAVGSIVPWKGLHHLVAAVAAVPDLRLVLVGDRVDEAYGRHLDALAVPERVRFAGWDERPGDWQAAADLVCLPTVEDEELLLEGRPHRARHTEGLSRTVLEAMAQGKPVVATRVAGAPEQIVDGETGLLVPPSDVAALARALALLARDADLRARMGAAAAARARARFSVEQMVAGTLGIYDELL